MRASSRAASGATSLSSRAEAVAGVARTTASASKSRGSLVSPTTSRQPPSGRWARSRTVAEVSIVTSWSSSHCAAATGNLPTPPRMPAKTGTSEPPLPDEARRASAAARISERSRSSSATTWGTAARAEISRACPAYTPPRSGSTRRSTTSRPSRSSTRLPMLMSASPSSVGGSRGSSAARIRPALESTGSRSTASPGTPINVRGSRTNRSRVHNWALVVAGCTIWPAMPTCAANAVASGRRLSIASAPRSTVTPATSPVCNFPPTRSAPSSTVTRRSGRRERNSVAAASPATPAPTTSTRGRTSSVSLT